MKNSVVCPRLFSFLLVLCLICELLPGVILPAQAAEGTWEYRILDSGEAEITGYSNKSAASLAIPLSLGDAWVRSIAPEALTDLTKLRTVQVPASVTEIAAGAFPDGVTLQAYHGASVHAYAKAAGLSSRDISAFDFMPSILDLSDMTASMWSMTNSTVRIGQPFACLISAGSKIYLPPRGGYSQGRPVLVQAMALEGDTAVLTVRDLAFSDAVASLYVKKATLVPDYSSFVPAEGVTVGLSAAAKGSGSSKSIPIQADLDVKGIQVSLSADLNVGGTINNVDYHDMALHAYSADVSVEAQNIELSISTGKEIQDELKKKESFIGRIGTLDFSAYGVVHLTMEIYLSISVDGSVTFYTQKVGGCAHMNWTKEAGGNSSFDTDVTPISFKEAAVNLRWGFLGEVAVELGFTQVDLAVKIASLEMFAGFEAAAVKTADTPCLDLQLDCIIEGSFSVGWLEAGKLKRDDDDDDDDDDDAGIAGSLSASWDIPVYRTKLLRRHWEECKVWQDYCTYHDECVFYFNTLCNIQIDPVYVKKGDTPSVPATPDREGYTFGGWYLDEAYTTQWDMWAPATEPATNVYARWDKDLPTPTPNPMTAPTPMPDSGTSMGGGLRYPPYPVFPAAETIAMLTYEYSSKYEGYILTGFDPSVHDVWTNLDSAYPDRKNIYLDNPWTVMLPNSINGTPVVGIEACDWPSCLLLPDTLKYIGPATFEYQTIYNLNSLYQLEDIAENAFYYAHLYEAQIVFPDSLKSIGASAFCGAGDLESVIFTGGETTVGDSAFSHVELKKVDLTGVVSIERWAFNDYQLDEIVIPASVREMGYDIFPGTIKRIYIAPRDTPLVLEHDAFAPLGLFGERELIFMEGTKVIDIRNPNTRNSSPINATSIYFPEGLTEIRSLPGIYSAKSVKFPSTLKQIGVWNPDGVQISGFCFSGIEDLVIPESVELLGWDAFFGSYIKTVKFNNKLREIPPGAFERCHYLQTLELPNSLETIAGYAFSYCSRLKTIYFPDNSSKPWNPCCVVSQAFYGCTSLESIYVLGDLDADEEIFGDPAKCTLKTAYITRDSMFDYYMQENYPDVQLVYHDETGGKKYTVTFETRGFAKVEPMKVEPYTLIPVPPAPVGDSRQFTGWYKDSHCLQPWNFANDLMPEENLTLYAGWKYTFTSQSYVENDEMTLTKLIAPEPDTSIPATLDNKRVAKLGAYCIPAEVVTLQFTASVYGIDPLAFASAVNLTSITVTPDSADYYTVDGVLYAKDGTLVCYPPAKSGKVFIAPEGTTGIAENAFYGVVQLESIILPESVKTIGSNAFVRCGALNSIELSADLASIADDALNGCNPALYGPLEAPVLKAWADRNDKLYNCYPLVCMSLNEVALAIPMRAGELLPAIPVNEKAEINVVGWAIDAEGKTLWDFDADVMPAEPLTLYAVWDYDFTWEEADGSVTLTGYIGDQTRIIIPKEIDGKAVNAISDDCFSGLSGITLVDDADSVAQQYAEEKGIAFEVRTYTVYFATNGGSLIDPVQVAGGKIIPLPEPPVKNGMVFSYWQESGLGYIYSDSEITMPKRDVYLSARYTTEDYDAVVYRLLYEIGDGEVIITGCTTSYGVTIPAEINGLPVTTIADNAFASARFDTISLPDSIVSIGKGAFRDCLALQSVTIPGSVAEIRQNTFRGCVQLSSVTLSEGISKIDEDAFAGCISLESLTLPASVESIHSQALTGSRSLRSLAVADAGIVSVAKGGSAANGAAYIALDGVLYTADGKTLVIYPEGKTEETYTIPDSVTRIGAYAMQNSQLKQLKLPAAVTAIGEGAFQFSEELETLSIPADSALSSIGSYAFAGCQALTSLTLPVSVQEVGRQAFALVPLTEVHLGTEVEIHDLGFTELDALVMYGKKGSPAHQWALNHKVRFIDLDTDIPVESISMPEELTLDLGETAMLSPVLTPADTTEKAVTYTSDKPHVASVDENGVVSAVFDGVAVITATAATGVTAECTVNVVRTEIPIESLLFSSNRLELVLGNTCIPSYTTYPANANTGAITWSSSNEAAAYWDAERSCLVAVGAGETTLTASLENGYSAELLIIVRFVPMERLYFDAERYTVFAGFGYTVAPGYEPENTTEFVDPVWTTDNPDVACWDAERNMLLTLSPGTTNLTITLPNGMSAACELVIIAPRELELPAAVTEIDAEAFMGCNFTHVYLPEGLVSIGERAFAECVDLDSVYIPESVVDIAPDAFEGCENMVIWCKWGSEAEYFAYEHGYWYMYY